jgi:SAM-dependent methyltransferase
MATYQQQMETLAFRQGGYFYPWRSIVGPGDGESAYAALVEAHLAPRMIVLEAGCGHGPDFARFAPRVARYIAYDYALSFIDRARKSAAAAGLANVECHAVDSSPARGGRLPADDGALDLVISRRGPTNFILDAPRACRPGATLVQLNPAPPPPPEWNDALAPSLRIEPAGFDIEARIARLLAQAGLAFASAEFFDTTEDFETPEQLWLRLSFLREDAPTFPATEAALTRIFRDHAGPGGLQMRHRRFLWTARTREGKS